MTEPPMAELCQKMSSVSPGEKKGKGFGTICLRTMSFSSAIPIPALQGPYVSPHGPFKDLLPRECLGKTSLACESQ